MFVLAQGEIRRSDTGSFIPLADIGQQRYLIFPILHQQDMTKRGVDHWAVLVMVTEGGSLRFYNSIRPRPGHKDPYLDDAKEVVGSSRIKQIVYFT